MFVCCSEISVNDIVKHVQHVGIISACSLPWADLLSFSVPEGTKKILGYGLLGISVPWLILCRIRSFNYSKICLFFFVNPSI